MENKTTKTNIKSLLFIFMLLVGVTLTTAQGVWKEAPVGSNPSNNIFKNVFGPITKGDENQEKSGQLITSGIVNNTGDFITYANLYVGNGGYKTPAYLFGDVYFPKMFLAGNTENKLCLSPEGKVRVCKDVSFKAVDPKYYTDTNTTIFPSGGIKGYVSYKIGQSQQCTTVNKTDTNWGGQTISGTNTKKEVIFYNWGTYDLKINCDGQEYTVTIKIGGKIVPTTVGTSIKYTLDLGTSRPAQFMLIGGGASGAYEVKDNCIVGFVGGSSSVKIGSTTIADVGGGGNPSTGTIPGCSIYGGSGGKVASGTQLSNVYSNNGYNALVYLGGCSGAPDANNDLNTCNGGGKVLPYGKAGSGNSNGRGGGGGAYITGTYTLPATDTLTTLVGEHGGKGRGATPDGQNGYISIEW